MTQATIRTCNLKGLDRPPTIQCSICNVKEDPEAIQTYIFGWICPECADKLRRLLGKNCGTCPNWITDIAYVSVGQCKLDKKIRHKDWYCADHGKTEGEVNG